MQMEAFEIEIEIDKEVESTKTTPFPFCSGTPLSLSDLLDFGLADG